MDRYFDTIYFALVAVIFSALGYATLVSLKLHGKARQQSLRRGALSISLGAMGTAVALLGGLFADSFLKSSAYFQQARFASYYVGFFLITTNLIANITASQETYLLPRSLSHPKVSSYIVWSLFFGTLVISVFYLVDPNTFILNSLGAQVQRVVYWIPMLTTTFVGAAFLFLAAIGINEAREREHMIWIGAFAAFLFIGLLRESLILPDLGDPLVNLLAAFVLFTIGSLCLGFGARSLLKGDEQRMR